MPLGARGAYFGRMAKVREEQLRFGILCNGKQLQLWQLKCLEELRKLPGAEAVVLLVCESTGTHSGRERASRFFPYFSKPARGSPACTGELPAYLTSLPAVELPGTCAGADIQPDSQAAATLRSHRLHFILSFVEASARTLNELAAFGVWMFEFGDWEHFRGSPPGFWEVYRNAKVSGALLGRLTGDRDVVIPLRRGYVSTCQFSYSQNRDQLLSRFTHWPADVCREILHADGACLTAEPVRGSSAINTVPCNAGLVRFVCRLTWYIVTRGMRSWLQQDHWNIGIIEQPIEELIDPRRERRPIKWLPAPGKGEFVADPFGLVRDGQLTILCEHLSYRDGIGTIAAIQLSDTPPLQPVSRIPVTIGPSPAVHLSYPSLLEHEGRILCIPETSGAREVALYGLARFPDRWIKLATLIENVSIVDATLFRHGGLWWLAGASDPGGASVGADLHLWYATDIMGPWIAHPGNPVKTDVRSARPAGTPFSYGGILYRPAQDSSRTYGSRVVINRVHTLTPTAFREEAVAFVEPDVNGPYPDGLHTLSAVGGITLVDGKRLQLAPAELRRILARMLRRRLQKLTTARARAGVPPTPWDAGAT